jgi:hypothetical protein
VVVLSPLGGHGGRGDHSAGDSGGSNTQDLACLRKTTRDILTLVRLCGRRYLWLCGRLLCCVLGLHVLDFVSKAHMHDEIATWLA